MGLLAFLYFSSETYFHIYQWNTEGIHVVGAVEVLNGAVPFRDFAEWPTPGSFYFLALVFKIFGKSLFAARFFMTCMPKWLIVILLYRAAKRIGLGEAAALAGCALATLGLGTGTFAGNDPAGVHSTVPATLTALASSCCLIEFLFTRRRGWLVLGGANVGLTFLMRYDMGLYALLAQLASAALSSSPKAGGDASKSSLTEKFGLLAVGIILAISPLAGYLLWNVPQAALKLSFVDYPRAYLEHVTTLSFQSFFPHPFPSFLLNPEARVHLRLRAWLLYDAYRDAVFLAFLASWFWWLKRMAADSLMDRREQAASALLFLGTCLWGYFIKSGNLFSFSAPFFILAAFLISRGMESRKPGPRRLSRLAAALAGGLGLLMFLCKPILPRPYHRLVSLPPAKGLLIPQEEAEALEGLQKFVGRHVPADGRIFIYHRRFDMGNETPLLLYFLLDRRPGASVYDFFPGITTRPDIQRRIAEELEVHRVSCVIVPNWPRMIRPQKATGTILENYIKTHFRAEASFGPYLILTRS